MDKLEEHIAKKLREREIKPSEAAWEKLEAQLGPAPSRKNKMYYWYAAAVFVGVLLVSAIYLRSGDAPQPAKVEVVESPTSQGQDGNEGKNDARSQQTGQKALVETIQKEEPIENNDLTIIELEEAPESETALVQTKDVAEVNNDPLGAEKIVIERKLEEVMAQVALLESQNEQVTEAEVDSLLRSAQREILAEKALSQNGPVDAMALLTEVEDELNQSFRDQIFDALKEGYFKLRTAVADRNN